MLNELHGLERGLAAHGLATVARHPDLSQLLKGDVIRVRLQASGAIDRLDLLGAKTRPEVWTLRDGKHNGFPGLKTARGLLALDDATRKQRDERWKIVKSPAAKRAEIEQLSRAAALDPDAMNWPKPGHRRRITERLEDLRSLENNANTAAVPTAFERFLSALEIKPPFLHQLFQALLERAWNGEDAWLDPVRSALVDAVPLAIDVTDDFARDAGDERQIEAVSAALSAVGDGDGGTESNSNDLVCALTGTAARLLEGSFPQPTLPSLGQTYLFSRNRDIRALARYGRNGPESMPVNADLVGRFSGVLATVTEEKRRDKTWQLLPTEAGDGQDLFIAFIASALDEKVAASLTTNEDDDEVSRPESMEAIGAEMIRFWKGVAEKAKPDEAAHILILRTVDPGNRKAVYDRRPAVETLHLAARNWAEAMANAPDWIGWPVFSKKKVVEGRPKARPPLSLIRLSRKLYIRGGREAADAPGVGGAEALALFLNEGDRSRRARRVLRLLLARQGGLLAGLAHAKLKGRLKDFDPKGSARIDALHTVSWMGALLSFLGRTKEIYMDDVGFKLGQLLAAADALHIGYCADRRSGDVPPSLVGASVFLSAGRNPSRALALLQQRIKPYIEWSDRDVEVRKIAYELRAEGKKKDEGHTIGSNPKASQVRASRIFNALDAAKGWKQLAADLGIKLAGASINEAFGAELLLGYVAGLKPEEKYDTAETQKKESAV